MKITFLGTGTSTGNPEIGCNCIVCKSLDQRDRRLRASILINIKNKNILIDCGPDFRQQMLNIEFNKLHAVLLTHEHYDHVGGLDDLRPFCKFGDVDIYAEQNVTNEIKIRIPYCFKEEKYPGVPNITLNEIENKPFLVDDIEIIPIRLMHHKLPILGYRIENMAYLTDFKIIPDEEFEKLKEIDTLIIDALRIQQHISHESLEEALINIEKIAPKKAFLIHMSHHIGLHSEVEKILPENVFMPYDGLVIHPD